MACLPTSTKNTCIASHLYIYIELLCGINKWVFSDHNCQTVLLSWRKIFHTRHNLLTKYLFTVVSTVSIKFFWLLHYRKQSILSAWFFDSLLLRQNWELILFHFFQSNKNTNWINAHTICCTIDVAVIARMLEYDCAESLTKWILQIIFLCWQQVCMK